MNPKTHRDIILPEIQKILNGLPDLKDKKVLEIGHGIDKQFRELFESHGMKYQGTDNYVGINNNTVNKETDELIPIHLVGDEYFYDSMENLKHFGTGNFDIVFSCHAFEHCERPVDALREMHRVLKLGGRIIIVTPWCCKHHIIDADDDHIFVLNNYQMLRLIHYVGFDVNVIEQKDLQLREQDFNLISVGVKNG